MFFEYLLRKNNLTAKEFIQQLSKELISRQEKISITQATKTAGSNLQASSDNASTYETVGNIIEYTNEDVWNDIVRIVQRQNNNGQIVLGTLSTALATESKAYAWAKSQYKGYVRSFLIDKFGHLLTIDYVDGRDVVALTQVEYQEKASKRKSASVKVADTENDAPNEQNQNSDNLLQFEKELSSLSVGELNTLKLIMQLAFTYCVKGRITGSARRSIKRFSKATIAEDYIDLSSSIENAKLALLATISRNEKMKEAMFTNDIDVIIDCINRELTNRGIISEEGRRTIPADIPMIQSVEVIVNAEFDGLDDWLPF